MPLLAVILARRWVARYCRSLPRSSEVRRICRRLDRQTQHLPRKGVTPDGVLRSRRWLRGDLPDDVSQDLHDRLPQWASGHGAALSRPAPAESLAGWSGEVRRM